MAVGPILTQGIGSFGSVNKVPTLGFATTAVAVAVVPGCELRMSERRIDYRFSDQRNDYRMVEE